MGPRESLHSECGPVFERERVCREEMASYWLFFRVPSSRLHFVSTVADKQRIYYPQRPGCRHRLGILPESPSHLKTPIRIASLRSVF